MSGGSFLGAVIFGGQLAGGSWQGAKFGGKFLGGSWNYTNVERGALSTKKLCISPIHASIIVILSVLYHRNNSIFNTVCNIIQVQTF